jgi:hypothetical protein
MNKAALWLGAATVVAGVAVQRPASAAEMFADVPTEHWAYQAVNNLQERGIVIGYPDGTFGGKRAMTRYEFAVATDRLMEWVRRSIQENKGPDSVAGLSRDEVQQMIDAAVKNLPTKEDLETVRRLTEEFREELQALGSRVEQMQRDLTDLKARVGAIEDKLSRWTINGEVNLIARGERGQRTQGLRTSPIDLDSRTDNNASNSILQDMKTLYSLDLGMVGKVGNGVTVNALINYGNYLPWVNSNRQNPGVNSTGGNSLGLYANDVSTVPGVPSNQGPGSPLARALSSRTITQGNFGKEATNSSFAEITPLKLYLNSPVRDLWFLKDIDATIGKFGVQFTPYTLTQVDPDSYTNVTLTDNGEIITSGAMARARIGGLHLQGYAGTHYVGRPGDSSVNSGYPVFISWGGPTVLSAMTYGALPIDQSMGVHGTYQLGRFAVGGTYIEGGLTAPIGTAGSPFSNAPFVNRPNLNNGGRAMVPKRAQVYGGNLSFPIAGRLAFTGEFASSNVLAGVATGDRKGVFPSNDRNAYDAKLTWGAGRLSLAGGYKRVDPFFGAPGSWGQIGRWKNPTNIEGWNVAGGYNFGGFTLKGSYEDYNSVKVDLRTNRVGIPVISPTPVLSGAFENDIKHYTAGVSFNLSPANNVDLGWEQARIRPWDAVGKTKENYYTIGLGHTFNQNTLVKVLYQVVDYKDNGAGLYTVPGGAYKGGIGVTQLSVRF